MEKRYAAIIPVAGLSSRMGSFKPLLELNGLPMIALTVKSVFDGGVQTACVITGRDAQEIESALSEFKEKSSAVTVSKEFSSSVIPNLLLTHNPAYAASDMLQSIKLGLAALLDGAALKDAQTLKAIFIIPGDMPAVSSDTFALLRETLESRKDYSVFVPTYNGRRGHPLLISEDCYRSVLAFKGDGGLRQALAGFERYEVPTNDPGVLLDADTPEDFEKLKAHMNRLF